MDEDLDVFDDNYDVDKDPDLIEYQAMLTGEIPYDERKYQATQSMIHKTLAWSNSVLEDISRESQVPEGVDLIGQQVIRSQINPYLEAVKFPHSLILGPPGIGKTHLARWIASYRMEPFEEFLAPLRAEQLPDTGMILIDEAHRQNRPEFLFPFMEKGEVCFMAATTRPELLDPAFVSRFSLRLDLEPLNAEDSETLIAKLLMTDADVSILARASAGNPRQAERIVSTAKALNTHDPEKILEAVRINADGMDDVHLKILRTMKRIARPVGVAQVATMLYTSEQDIKEHERLLMAYGLIDMTTGGRMLTKKGQKYAEAI